MCHSADDSYRYVEDKMATVNSTGYVTWSPHARLHTYCDLDLTRFPFDEQQCKIWIGSWTYDNTLVNISIFDPTNLKFINQRGEWVIKEFNAKSYLFSDGVKTYPSIIYQLRMKRVSLYYQYFLVGPTVILAILILALYWIPPDSNQRFMMGEFGMLVYSTVHYTTSWAVFFT